MSIEKNLRPELSSGHEKAMDAILEATRQISELFPECVFVGGTASVLHANHRYSIDADGVMIDLRKRYKKLLKQLSDLSGWQTAKGVQPVLILGKYNGVDIGIRQLKRSKPLETEIIEGIKIPTIGEMLRVKGWMIVSRNAVRDYLDFVALFDTMEQSTRRDALLKFDSFYPQPEGSETTLLQLGKMLVSPKPYDIKKEKVIDYKGIRPPWNSWEYIIKRGGEIADFIFDLAMGPDREQSIGFFDL